ncbi:MAG: 4-(cytidine 5'-diphospho)-2-C-methyl-D-erythritol kinase [Bacteroidota bacterium]
MILEQRAPAKLNLGLHVLQKRADGYHDIETVFLPVAWYDSLRAEPHAAWQFTCSDAELPTDDGNLCVRAAQQLQAVTGVGGGARLHLEKHLPYGAGLGGGSSDAAHTLRMLNKLWDAGASKKTLHTIAAGLGADVAFFLEDQPMFATGLGEQLEPLLFEPHLAYRFPYALVIVVPPVHVGTADAYRGIIPNNNNRPDIRALVMSNDLSRWRKHLVNDFEETVFQQYPVIQQVKEHLLASGAGYAAMSGSGSSVFGVFEEQVDADRAAVHFEQAGMRTWTS